jgi:hypothetical protein
MGNGSSSSSDVLFDPFSALLLPSCFISILSIITTMSWPLGRLPWRTRRVKYYFIDDLALGKFALMTTWHVFFFCFVFQW